MDAGGGGGAACLRGVGGAGGGGGDAEGLARALVRLFGRVKEYGGDAMGLVVEGSLEGAYHDYGM